MAFVTGYCAMNNLSTIKIVFLILSGFFVLYVTRDFNRLDNRNKPRMAFLQNSGTVNKQQIQIRENSTTSKRKFFVRVKKNGNVNRMKKFGEMERNLVAAHIPNADNQVDERRDFQKMGQLSHFNLSDNKKGDYFLSSLHRESLGNILKNDRVRNFGREQRRRRSFLLKRNESKDSTRKNIMQKNISPIFPMKNIVESRPNKITKMRNTAGDTFIDKIESEITSTRTASGMVGRAMKHSKRKKETLLNGVDFQQVDNEESYRFLQNKPSRVIPEIAFSSKKILLSTFLPSFNKRVKNKNENKVKYAYHKLNETTESKENFARNSPEKLKMAQLHVSKPLSSLSSSNNIDENDSENDDDIVTKNNEDDDCPDNKDRHILRKLLQKWNHLATENGITYYLFFGTLLGHHRNGDILPWDTDVDVAVDARDYRVLRKLASPRTFKYKKHDKRPRLVVQEDLTFPLARRTRLSCDGRVVARNVDGCSFQDPMARVVLGDRHVDIFAMYKHNRSHLHEPTENLTFRATEIFPLKECRFLGVNAKCPAFTKSVLRKTYGRGFRIPGKICIRGKWTNRNDID